MKKYKTNNFETKLFTKEDIDLLRPKLLAEHITKCSAGKHKKVPLIKRLWYNFLASKKVGDTSKKLDIKDIKRVLLLRYDALGDYIVSTPIISFLKKNNPNIIIDVVTSSRNDAFIRADKNISNTYVVHQKLNFVLQTLRSVFAMRKNKYDIIFALVFSKNTRAAELAYMISPSAHKICFSSHNSAEMYLQIFDTAVTTYHYEYHYCEKMFKAINAYFGDEHNIKDYPIYVPILQKDINNAAELAIKNGLYYKPDIINLLGADFVPDIEGKKYVIINLTSYNKQKIFNADVALQLISYLANKYPTICFYITGAPDYNDLYVEIVKKINLLNCFILKVSFSTYTAILVGAALLITPCSAPVHIAAAANVPIVDVQISSLSLFEWAPYNTNFILCWGGEYADINNNIEDIPNINLIDTNKIIEAAEKYL